MQGFPEGPVVKNLLCKAGDARSIPGQGAKIPHGAEQLSPRAATTRSPGATTPKPGRHNSRVPVSQCNTPPDTVRVPRATAKTQHSQIKKQTLDQSNEEMTAQHASTRGGPHHTGECCLQLWKPRGLCSLPRVPRKASESDSSL